jgi:hypothetical protein
MLFSARVAFVVEVVEEAAHRPAGLVIRFQLPGVGGDARRHGLHVNPESIALHPLVHELACLAGGHEGSLTGKDCNLFGTAMTPSQPVE